MHPLHRCALMRDLHVLSGLPSLPAQRECKAEPPPANLIAARCGQKKEQIGHWSLVLRPSSLVRGRVAVGSNALLKKRGLRKTTISRPPTNDECLMTDSSLYSVVPIHGSP